MHFKSLFVTYQVPSYNNWSTSPTTRTLVNDPRTRSSLRPLAKEELRLTLAISNVANVGKDIIVNSESVSETRRRVNRNPKFGM